MFLWACEPYSQPHLVLLELRESEVMDLIEPYLAHDFLRVILLRNYDGGFYGSKNPPALTGQHLFIDNCY